MWTEKGSAAKGPQGSVERGVAGQRRHVREREVGEPEGRQDSGQYDVAAALLSGLAGGGDQVLGLLLERKQRARGQPLRGQVPLDVEPGDLRSQPRIVGPGQHLHRDRRGLHRAVDEEHLLLRTDPPYAALDPAGLEQPLQGLDIAQYGAGELPDLPLVQITRYVLGTHRRSPPARSRLSEPDRLRTLA